MREAVSWIGIVLVGASVVAAQGSATDPNVEALIAAAQEVEGAPSQEIAPSDPVVPAAAEVVQGRPARTISSGVAVRHPYGQSQPTLTCAPLHACALELQAGEQIVGVALGDSERWITAALEGARPLLVVKPTTWDLATNMMVSTDRRVYHVGLRSPREGASANYDRVVGFWYPEEIVRVYGRMEHERKAQAAQASASTAETLAIPLEAIDHSRYAIRGDRVSWRPEVVLDDGARTYIRFASGLGSKSAPALLVQGDTGEAALANHRVLPGGRWWVIDGVFRGLELVQGTGRSAKKVRVKNGSWSR